MLASCNYRKYFGNYIIVLTIDLIFEVAIQSNAHINIFLFCTANKASQHLFTYMKSVTTSIH